MAKKTPTSSRRSLLKAGLGAAAIAPFLSPMRSVFAEDQPQTAAALAGRGKAKQIVYLYMSGGASHFETMDPKPGNSAGGPTKAIQTAVSGIQIAESLPGLAKRMRDIAIIRGMTSREGNHERARYLMHTGYAPNPTLTHASVGAIVSKEIGNPSLALPNYITINGPGGKAGYLGVNYEPFQITVRGSGEAGRGGQGQRRRRRGRQDGAVVQNMKLPQGIGKDRRDRRLKLLGALNEGFSKDRGHQVAEAQGAMFERARKLMDSPRNTAFDLQQESADTRAKYGTTNFGQGVLMARRLLDQGVAFVEITMGGWDTHDDNFARIKTMNAQVDQAVSTLIDDLKASGRLDETLIVWVGDFGRTPRITASDGRGHYPRAWSTFLAGGGVQGGRVIGATSEDGSKVVDGAVTVPQFFGSIAHATGIRGNTTQEVNGRPISYVDEGGNAVADLFKS